MRCWAVALVNSDGRHFGYIADYWLRSRAERRAQWEAEMDRRLGQLYPGFHWIVERVD